MISSDLTITERQQPTRDFTPTVRERYHAWKNLYCTVFQAELLGDLTLTQINECKCFDFGLDPLV